MNRKIYIGAIIVLSVLVILTALSTGYLLNKSMINDETYTAYSMTGENVVTDKESIETQTLKGSQVNGEAVRGDGYYMVLKDKRVCIYRGDDKVFYDYAEINVETMPEEVKEQLVYGLYLSDVEELYDFLQTYSS